MQVGGDGPVVPGERARRARGVRPAADPQRREAQPRGPALRAPQHLGERVRAQVDACGRHERLRLRRVEREVVRREPRQAALHQPPAEEEAGVGPAPERDPRPRGEVGEEGRHRLERVRRGDLVEVVQHQQDGAPGEGRRERQRFGDLGHQAARVPVRRAQADPCDRDVRVTRELGQQHRLPVSGGGGDDQEPRSRGDRPQTLEKSLARDLAGRGRGDARRPGGDRGRGRGGGGGPRGHRSSCEGRTRAPAK